MDAFKNSIKLGANMLEMDVCRTKDDKIIVFHDIDLLRMCGINKKITEFNYEQIPKFLDEVE